MNNIVARSIKNMIVVIIVSVIICSTIYITDVHSMKALALMLVGGLSYFILDLFYE